MAHCNEVREFVCASSLIHFGHSNHSSHNMIKEERWESELDNIMDNTVDDTADDTADCNDDEYALDINDVANAIAEAKRLEELDRIAAIEAVDAAYEDYVKQITMEEQRNEQNAKLYAKCRAARNRSPSPEDYKPTSRTRSGRVVKSRFVLDC